MHNVAYRSVRPARLLRLCQAVTNHQRAQNHSTIHTLIGTYQLAYFVQLMKK